MLRKEIMRWICFITFIASINDAFLVYPVQKRIIDLHMSSVMDPPTRPPTSSLVTTGGGGDNEDIKIMTPEETEITLDIWSSKPNWVSVEIEHMHLGVDKDSKNDIYFGYTPKYNNRRDVIYIFHTQILMNNSNPYLSVLSGVNCPFDESGIPSIGFKSALQKSLHIIPIDFSPIMQHPKFRLSWNY